jgi:hypothetical protein
MKALREEHAAEIVALREEHAAELKALRDEHSVKLKAASEEIAMLTEELKKYKSERDNESGEVPGSPNS